jgi:ATP-dependent DNA helicase MPH1
MLNQHPELLRATKFVGQSQGKQEIDKGFNQKEQKKVCRVSLAQYDHHHPQTSFFLLLCILEQVLISQTIQEFKEGKFNILVSTSIGEEGLDIGEVDFVVIYDMPKQSIKLVSYHLPYRGLSSCYSSNVLDERAESVMERSTSSCLKVERI